MATPLKSLASAIPGLVVHFFDEELGQVLEAPVVAVGLDAKGDIHPIIITRKFDDEELLVGSRYVRADTFKEYLRTLVHSEDDDEEAEASHSMEIASNIGLGEKDEDTEAEDEDVDDDDDDDESGAGDVRMASGDL